MFQGRHSVSALLGETQTTEDASFQLKTVGGLCCFSRKHAEHITLGLAYAFIRHSIVCTTQNQHDQEMEQSIQRSVMRRSNIY